MTLTVTKAFHEDAAKLELRAADLSEVRAWVPGVDPQSVIELSIKASSDAFTGWDAGRVVAIGGWSWDGPDRILPWLLGSDLVDNHRKDLMRWGRSFIDQLRKAHPDKMLCNHVAKNNAKARRFLKALGFTIVPSPGTGEFDFFYLT